MAVKEVKGKRPEVDPWRGRQCSGGEDEWSAQMAEAEVV